MALTPEEEIELLRLLEMEEQDKLFEPQPGPQEMFLHTDADIALLGAYLRRTRTDLPPWPDLAAAVAARRPSPTSIR